jgi:hypothetical protein
MIVVFWFDTMHYAILKVGTKTLKDHVVSTSSHSSQ